jgi:SagB-type dehydrogenase family enzyme
MQTISEGRDFLKADLWDQWDSLQLDQRQGIPHPPAQKLYPESATLIALTPPENFRDKNVSVLEAIRNRSSHRSYTGESISLTDLSFLLWTTQGVHEVLREGETTIRTVPSAGARHPFETYMLANYVEDLEVGIYRYLAIEHKLLQIEVDEGLVEDVYHGTNEQYVHDSAVVFIWTVIPYRTEWRYGPLSHKMIAQDSGHLCQNLYLACESLGLGTCAIGAYNQGKMDRILSLDGKDEFTIYVATVGRLGS